MKPPRTLTDNSFPSARRPRMARMARFIGTAVVGIALTGCVSQEKYNALKLDRDGLAEQLAKAQSDASSARAEADSFKNQLGLLGQNSGGLQGLVTICRTRTPRCRRNLTS